MYSSTDGDFVRGRGCAANSSKLASSMDTSRTLRSSTPGMAGLAVPSRNAYRSPPPPNLRIGTVHGNSIIIFYAQFDEACEWGQLAIDLCNKHYANSRFADRGQVWEIFYCAQPSLTARCQIESLLTTTLLSLSLLQRTSTGSSIRCKILSKAWRRDSSTAWPAGIQHLPRPAPTTLWAPSGLLLPCTRSRRLLVRAPPVDRHHACVGLLGVFARTLQAIRGGGELGRRGKDDADHRPPYTVAHGRTRRGHRRRILRAHQIERSAHAHRYHHLYFSFLVRIFRS